MKSKYQIEIDAFRCTFNSMRDKKIVIYGIGRRTATLLPEIADFNVVGLLDRESCNLGKIISGIPVISLSEAAARADVIIINSDPTNFYTIYRRIAEIQLPVYYASGEVARIKARGYENNPYWEMSFASLLDEIDKHKIISFDFFDTLVMRKILLPTDVFRLLEKRAKELYGFDFDVFTVRQAAIGEGKEKHALPEIYEAIASQVGISSEDACRLMELELSIEYEVCVPRWPLLQALKYAVDSGKKVLITSDTFLTMSQMRPLLLKCGLRDFPEKQLLLSSELGLYKRSGTIWRCFNGLAKPDTILHIGDDEIADISMPKRHGFHAYRIFSGKELLEASSVGELLPKAVSLSDAVHLGLIVAKLFANPFILAETQGKIAFDDARTFGYAVFGGVLARFIMWLYARHKEQGYEKLLFFARDGYFLTRNFRFLLGVLQEKEVVLPKVEVQYVPVSRRLLYLTTMQTEEDFRRVASFPYLGTFASYLHSRFNIKATESTADINDIEINATDHIDILMQWLEPYREAIWDEANREKSAYTAYLRKEGLFDGNHEATVDFSYYGTNQYYFQKLVQRKFDGYYFSACHALDNEYKSECVMYGCFNSREDPKAERSFVKKKSAFLESFLTAPYGMIRYVEEDGKLVCEPAKKNQKSFSVKEEANEGMKEYIKEFVSLYGLDNRAGYESMEAYTYYTFLNGNATISNEIGKGFYFDNDMVGDREVPLEI